MQSMHNQQHWKDDTSQRVNYHSRWKRSAVEKGLLENNDREIRKRSKTALASTGVSVAFLQSLADTLEELDPPWELETCSTIQKLFVPATKLCTSLRQSGAKAAASSKDVDVHASMDGHHAKSFRQYRLWDFIPTEHTGIPQFYVIHSWQADMPSMLRQVASRLEAELEHLNMTGALESVYVWLDFISLVQGSTLVAPIGIPEVKEVVASCSGGGVVAVDPDFTLLSRTWCLFEMWSVAYQLGPGKLLMCIPEDMTPPEVVTLQHLFMRELDIVTAECTKPVDKQHILAEAKRSVGIKRCHQMLNDTTVRCLRTWLRWSGSFRLLVLYVSLLLESGEYGQLLMVLHSIPEVYDDAKALHEIRLIFNMFDADGGGELDEDEFAEALGMAGYGADEAREMFNQVDTDGGGSVSIDEFELWWMETQRQQASYRPKIELNFATLAEMLPRFMELMERKGLGDQVPYFRRFLRAIESCQVVQKNMEFPPPILRGDWRTVTEHCGVMIGTRDYRGLARGFYEVLSANGDLLSHHPRSLPTLDGCKTQTSMRTVIADYMETLAGLLGNHAVHSQQVAFLVSEARDLRANASEHMGHRMDATQARQRHDREQIVNSMVKLKYGKKTPISNRLITEAEMSLSQWIASQKQQKLQAVQEVQRKGVQDFAVSYLACTGTLPILAAAAADPKRYANPAAIVAAARLELEQGGGADEDQGQKDYKPQTWAGKGPSKSSSTLPPLKNRGVSAPVKNVGSKAPAGLLPQLTRR